MLGYSKEEACTLSPEHVHPPEVMPKVWKHLEATNQGKVARIDDLPFLCKDGSILYADVISSPINYNQRPGSISFFHDVTERKQTHEALESRAAVALENAAGQRSRTANHFLRDPRRAGPVSCRRDDAVSGPRFAAAKLPGAREKGLRDRRGTRSSVAFESRRLISEVRPPIIDEIGLVTAISHLVHEHRRLGGPKIECHSSVQFGRLPPILENALYRIVQEALTNACKHSQSKKVTVTMTQEGQKVRMEVRDWGIGFDPESLEKGHFGLEGIRQRVRLLGGRLTVQSTRGFGTLLEVVVPIVEQQNEGISRPVKR